MPKAEFNPAELKYHLCTAEIYNAIVMVIKDYFRKMGFTKAILGSSGGIDSAVTLALASETLGKESVRAVLMLSPYSTGHSASDAEQLSKNIYESFLAELKPIYKDLLFV